MVGWQPDTPYTRKMARGMTQASATDRAVSSDGRHQRRHRNREAALDALMTMLDEGHLYPTAAEVAERAGLSARSMFRYFEDVADLQREALNRLSIRFAPELQTMAIDPSLPLADRVEATAKALDRIYHLVRSAALAARLRAPDNPQISDQMALARSVMRGYLAATFEPELRTRRGKARQVVLAALDVWATFEVQHVLREQGPVEGADPVKVTALGLQALLQSSA